MCRPSSAVTAGAPPPKGTKLTWACCSCAMRAKPRCDDAPITDTPTVVTRGLAFAKSIRSFSVR